MASNLSRLGELTLRRFDGSTLDWATFHEATATDAMVVLADGELVYEYYTNGMNPDSRHILMSATKSLVGLVAGILVDQGSLEADGLVSRYVPEIAKGPYAEATVRQLLDMRTDINLDETQQAEYAVATGWNPRSTDGAPRGLHAFFENLDGAAGHHGGAFSYVSANYDLLGWVIERAAGGDLCTLIANILWTPMAARHDASMTLDPSGDPRATGGLSATARDFARVGQLILEGGGSILPDALIADIIGGGDRDAWASGQWGPAFAQLSKDMGYRSGWYTMHGAPEIVFAMGIHGQNLLIDRGNRIVVAKLSSWAQETDYAALPLTHMALPEIRRLVAAAAGC